MLPKKSDRIIYENSLKQLVDRLNDLIQSSDTDIVIALSRKGPRLLEYLRIFKGLKLFSFTTEHALPIIFEKISREKNKVYRIFLIDDAIYFGSTIQNLYNEIQSYIRAYALDNVKVVAIFTAIKAKDSKVLNFGDAELVASYDDIREGYGHYFVKSLMNDFAKLNDTMEVEFPSVEYSFDKQLDGAEVEESLKLHFNNVIRVSVNDDYPSKWSILLGEDDFSSFNKIRVFMSENKLRFVFMNPHYFDNHVSALERLMSGQGSPFQEIWQEISNHFVQNVEFDAEIRRNRLRTQVILANYMLSFNQYLVNKQFISSIVSGLSVKEISCKLKKTNLYYLLGDDNLVGNTIGRLKVAADAGVTMDFVSAVKELKSNGDYVLESESLPKNELEVLTNHNLAMLEKCQSAEEAFSAIFNNLTLLIEKWTRGTIYDDKYRLRFGYSLKSLSTFVFRYTKFALNSPVDFLYELHSWIDGRIDNGCIVPQYIVDSKSNSWVRVFRTGENEDLLLSHLARLVLHVWNQINQTIAIGKVSTYNFQSVLSLLIDKFGNILHEEEPYLCLSVNHSIQPCWGNSGRKVVEYLKDMYILTEEYGFLEISTRLKDKEFQSNTTLSYELEAKIDLEISNILSTYPIKDNPYMDISGDLNYRLKQYIDFEEVYNIVDTLKSYILIFIEHKLGKDGHVSNMTKEEEDTILYNYNEYVKPYLFSDEIVLRMKEDGDTLYDIELKLQKILSVFNVLLMVYDYEDDALIDNYLLNSGFLRDIGMGDVVAYLTTVQERKAQEEYKESPILMEKIKHFIETI